MIQNNDSPMDIFVGYDSREAEAFDVCRFSLLARSSIPLRIQPLGQPEGLYRRTWHMESGQRVDDRDGRPFSTEFAFSRFLVPAIMNGSGWALYCDCDFLFLDDVAQLIELRDSRFAVQCVKHQHEPRPSLKIFGSAQVAYPRKNWSSLVLWNCAHPANRALTVDAVNSQPGRWLHGFSWLKDEDIGALPEVWNWLSGWSSPDIAPKAVHYTGGGPWVDDCRAVPLADLWLAEREAMLRGINPGRPTAAVRGR